MGGEQRMKKIRDGIGGELTAEIFETWYPDNPALILLDFVMSDLITLFVVVKLNDTDIAISHITIEYAHKLLDEFKVLRGQI